MSMGKCVCRMQSVVVGNAQWHQGVHDEKEKVQGPRWGELSLEGVTKPI